MINNSSSPTKKRKANDGRAAATDGAHDVSAGSSGFLSSWFGYFSGRRDGSSSALPTNENNATQLDRMEQMMTRMEEKLATVSRLESRCEELERKCSSLETLSSRMDKTLKYHEILIRNQKWEYPVPLYTINELVDCDSLPEVSVAEAVHIYQTSELLKDIVEALRRGDFPEVVEDPCRVQDRGINLATETEDVHPYMDEYVDHVLLYPHWREFAAALRQFKPAFDVQPDNCDTFITFSKFQLNSETTQLVTEALTNMPFKKFSFRHNHCFDGGMSTITSLIDRNKFLQKLLFERIEYMCSNNFYGLVAAIYHHPSLVDVTFSECFGIGFGDEMLAFLLANNDLKLERLSLPGNHLLGSESRAYNVCERLSNYLASNPRLKELNLERNQLNDNDASLIANALRSNTTLRYLYLEGNRITMDGFIVLHRAFYDGSSLNSAADSNHTCLRIETDPMGVMNNSGVPKDNRAWKIYTVLIKRHKTISNVQYFGDIDIKLLPNMLQAVQKYSLFNGGNVCRANALSIVYEIMHRWDKVSPLYKTLGKPL